MLKKIFVSLGLLFLLSTQTLFAQGGELIDEMKLEREFIEGMKKITLNLQEDYLQKSCALIKEKDYTKAANMTILGALSADQDSINALCQLNYPKFSEVSKFLDENFNSIYNYGKPIDFTTKEDSIFQHLFKMREILKEKYKQDSKENSN